MTEPAREGFTFETWTYTGRRYPTKGTKPAHSYLDGDGSEYRYTVGQEVVGGQYRVEVKREDDSVRAGLTDAQFTGERHDDTDLVALWEATDAGTRRRLAREAAERKIGRDSEFDRALEPLLRIARKARNHHEAGVLAQLVSERITQEYYQQR